MGGHTYRHYFFIGIENQLKIGVEYYIDEHTSEDSGIWVITDFMIWGISQDGYLLVSTTEYISMQFCKSVANLQSGSWVVDFGSSAPDYERKYNGAIVAVEWSHEDARVSECIIKLQYEQEEKKCILRYPVKQELILFAQKFNHR